MIEIWKDIKGYNGTYQVSNFGNIRNLRRNMKPSIHPRGYLMILLSKHRPRKNWLIHRLVAIHFISNPKNYPCINHIDSNPSNNIVSNLEWCTQKQNVAHCIKMGRKNFQLNKGLKRYNEKMVINLWSGVYYDNIKEAAKAAEVPITTLAYRLKHNTSQYQIV